ncbi:hypothetical protein LOD99_10293 [Oopsacas minuta]|uniref:Uncharacterized protein n=1 Tax=Oopsacas minuta TaxID=111878 RepID=A0AAV7KHB0_9METZ|nr:hypothetical protein LOD99_10293 [Oopsacas minuta]
MQTNEMVKCSAMKIYNQLKMNDNTITRLNLHALYSKLYTAGCNDQEIRVIMKLRRNAQSRKHPENCKRKQIELEDDVIRLRKEKEILFRERLGLVLEISLLGEVLLGDRYYIENMV